VNPAHVVNGNITLSYERFTGSRSSFKVILSGGEQANYLAVAFDLNYYPAPPAAVNYFIGGSFMTYESPIVTGVPVSQPWNRFFLRARTIGIMWHCSSKTAACSASASFSTLALTGRWGPLSTSARVNGWLYGPST
jgi:hypothetical protein